MGKSSKDGLLAPLLGQDGSRFVLSVRVVGQLRRAGGHRALQDGLLQVVEHRRVLLRQERHGHTALTSTTSTTDTMDVVCGGGGGRKTRVMSFYLHVFKTIQTMK